MSMSRESVRANVPALQLRSVTKSFGVRRLLDAVCLDIDPGERVVLLGESGSGKSTLLNLIAGLEPPDAGEIRIAGARVDSAHMDRSAELRLRHIGFVFQAFHLLAHLDALSNVMVPLLLARVSPSVAASRARDMLGMLGLAEQLDAMPATLSGGEQQRVAIARALVHEPGLVLADEPTGNLDLVNAERVLELLCTCCSAYGAALLMVSHAERATRVATRVIHLADARLYQT